MTKAKKECGGSKKKNLNSCKTINLAKEGMTMEERKTKLLIFESGCVRKKKFGHKLPVGLTIMKKPTRIRMCTAEDLKTTCPPPLCECPSYKPPLGPLAVVRKMLGFGVRTALVGGFIYKTWKTGIWGSARETECIYVSLKNALLATEPDEMDSSPQFDKTLYVFRQKWNRAVSTTFSMMALLAQTLKGAQREEECITVESRSRY